MKNFQSQIVSLLITITPLFILSINASAQYTDVNFGGSGVSISYYPSGSDGTSQGDIILYENAATVGGQSVDCYVIVDSITGTSLTNVDQNSTSGSYYSNNEERFFSPFTNMPSGGGISRFNFQFVQDGTFSFNSATNQVTATNITIDSVRINSYDLDGNGNTNSNQYTEFGGFTSSELDANTNLVFGTPSSSSLTKWISNTNAGTTNATDPANRVRVFYDTMSSFQISIGSGSNGLAYFFLEFAAGYNFPNSLSYQQASGNVYNDTNGLYGDALVNGNGMGIAASSPLYVGLINSGDSVVATTAVLIDGSYTFSAVSDGSYNLLLTDQTLTINSTGNSPSLPNKYVNTGETSDNTSGNDGVVDGKISMTINGGNIENANFGINMIPEVVNIINKIGNPGHGDTLTVGYTSLISGGMGDMPFANDAEQGKITSIETFYITSLPTSTNQLLYDGVQLTFGDNGTSIPTTSNPYTITNVDFTKLRFVVNDKDSVQFDYSIMDAAGSRAQSSATYAYFWSTPLPVELINFTADRVNSKNVNVEWTTATEFNNDYFEVQKSVDGTSFITIGKVHGKGTSLNSNYYQFMDQKANSLNENLYYRLKQTDFDGTTDFSDIIVVKNENNDQIVDIYPNPARDVVNIINKSDRNDVIVRISDMNGRTIILESMQSKLTLNTSEFTQGVYILSIEDKNQIITRKIAINR